MSDTKMSTTNVYLIDSDNVTFTPEQLDDFVDAVQQAFIVMAAQLRVPSGHDSFTELPQFRVTFCGELAEAWITEINGVNAFRAIVTIHFIPIPEYEEYDEVKVTIEFATYHDV